MNGHGSYELTVRNQVVIAKIIGAWNKEESEQYICALKRISQDIRDKPWAIVVNLTEWELATPECDEVNIGLLKWLMENNLKKSAEVYSPSILKKMHIQNIVDQTTSKIDRQLFSNDVAAHAWLESQGFSLGSVLHH